MLAVTTGPGTLSDVSIGARTHLQNHVLEALEEARWGHLALASVRPRSQSGLPGWLTRGALGQLDHGRIVQEAPRPAPPTPSLGDPTCTRGGVGSTGRQMGRGPSPSGPYTFPSPPSSPRRERKGKCSPSGVSNSLDCTPQDPVFLGFFSGKNTAVGCHCLLQGVFWTERSSPPLLSLLHWQVDSSPRAPPGKPCKCILFTRCPWGRSRSWCEPWEL